MYLQTNPACWAAFACAKKQVTSGSNRRNWIAAAPATLLLLGTMIAAAPIGAQIAPVNSEGSPAHGQVNFGGSPPQATVNQFDSSSSSSESKAVLPEAPGAILQEQLLLASTPTVTRPVVVGEPRVAPLYMKRIPAGWTAQPLTARDKMAMGARDLFSPVSLIGFVATAGYQHSENTQPNFGTDKGAFGQRLGAASLRISSEGVFTDMVFAPLLHQDSRYYVEGPQNGFFHRVVYAITRPLITRSDSGRQTVNGSQLLGNASASALSYTYYPKINQNFHDTAATFGVSLLGSAIGDLVREFSGQLLAATHLKKVQ